MIFFRHSFDCKLKYLHFETTTIDEHVIRNTVESYLGYTGFTLLYNGRKLHHAEVVPDNSTVHVTFSLPGGKGGFGSMLRAIGAQIEKTTNREACRDLSGRRLRDINEEQRLKKWIAKEAEREAEKKKRRQARIERLKSKPAHKFFDYDYEKEISALPERIDEALSEGLQKAKQPAKRQSEVPGTSQPPLKKKPWLSDDVSSTSSDSDVETDTAKDDTPSKMPLKDSSSYDSSSDLSQPGPSSSKQYLSVGSEENSVTYSEYASSDEKPIEHSKDISNDSVKVHFQCLETEDVCVNNALEVLNNVAETKTECFANSEAQSCIDVSVGEDAESERNPIVKDPESNRNAVAKDPESNVNAQAKDPEIQDNSPINLLDYQSPAELEALGLDKLKMELMSCGLKCGGSLSDRAQRLWKVRGLQPNEYPSNLLAKKK